MLARGALAGEHRRSVYLVNRRGGEILGHPVHRTLAELPEPPELVVVAVPAEGFEEAVEGSLAAGARAIVGISAGLGELGGAGRAREAVLGERVRAAGAALLGPNCLGVFDAEAELQLVWGTFPTGAIGLLSQSGNLALEIGGLAGAAGLGLSRFASLGNQADLTAAELLDEFREHPPTKLIALYLEDFRDGRAFARSARAAVEVGKPVVLMTAGGSPAGARAARSHTGALVSDRRVVEAACRAAGIVLVETPAELVNVAQALLAPAQPRGRRVAVVGDGGGHNAVAADLLTARGLELPLLPEQATRRLAAILGPRALPANPVDLAGSGVGDVGCYERVVGALAAYGNVDTILLTGYFGGYGDELELATAHKLPQTARAAGVALVVHSMHGDSAASRALRAAGVPVYRTIESAVGALARLQARMSTVPVPELPELEQARAVAVDGYWGARELVAAAGIELVEALPARSLAEARAAAAELGFPVVLKALGRLHKSDAGGVVLGLDDDEALMRTFTRLERALSPSEFSVERMATPDEGLELIVGTRRDPRFGPVVVVGVGGIYAEILDDVAVALAPVNACEAESLLRGLRGAPLLAGARGRPPLALAAAAEAVARLSTLAAARPDLGEIEINPLFVDERRAIALDARVLRALF